MKRFHVGDRRSGRTHAASTARRRRTGRPSRSSWWCRSQPGGGADMLARFLGDPLSKRLGQPIVIENKPGAGATIGADLVAKAAPDGYTMLFTTPGPQITNPYPDAEAALRSRQGLRAGRDAGEGGERAGGHAGLPVKSIAELIAYAKANPGKLNFSSSGVGASSHLSGELFKMLAGIDIVHVPYRGSGPSIQDMLAGNIQMSIDTVSTMLPHIQSGGMRALARRHHREAIRRCPSCRRSPRRCRASTARWINYISVPAGTPQPIIDRLNKRDQRGAVRSGGGQAHGDRGLDADRREPGRPGPAHRGRAGEVEEGDRAGQMILGFAEKSKHPFTTSGTLVPVASKHDLTLSLRPYPERTNNRGRL